jgi:tetratricopeptide (TPR) repeat protein/formylmethanofuran dehydrogenase subunit E
MVYLIHNFQIPGTFMQHLCSLLLLALISAQALAAEPAQKTDPAWVGATECKSCHESEFQAWQGSHHDLAMQQATSTTVLGDFDNATFDYAGLTHRFFQRDQQFWVETDGPDGKLQEYRVEYVFGFDPLQQYLLALPGGRLQALSIAWDSRPAAEQGQRWYHLHPDEVIDATDPLHWTGPFYNWNSRCAECHSTNLKKNFDLQTAEFATTWSEVNVACEGCHGPGRRHVELAKRGTLDKHPRAGFHVDLGERGMWAFTSNETIAKRRTPLAASAQIENCALCHSRRGVMAEYEYGGELLDSHRLSLLESSLYHPDGQIQDEVYVHGSFIQSKMHQAGVVCSNCHEPHSLKLRAPGNGVCAQCHKPEQYDTGKHHHHSGDSTGAQCANCHMAETTYMGVDPRRDHSLRIPRPDLSVVMGTPNACNQCHTEQDADWALEATREWGIQFHDTGSHPSRTLQRARQGDARSVPALQQLALDPDSPDIWRATAMSELGGFANREAYDTALQLLKQDDALLRMAAVGALEFLPRQQLFGVLSPYFNDPSLAVRMEIARALASVPLDQVNPGSAEQLKVLFDEYLKNLGQNADMPETQLQLGVFFSARQFWEPAEIAYRRALQLNPQFLPALLNLADLYRVLEREDEARQVLQQAILIAPDSPVAYHALGLLETRAGNSEVALENLGKAASLEQTGVRNRYVYAIALHDSGQGDKAITKLKALLRVAPENPDILVALVTYSQGAGRTDQAKRYANKLKQLMPNDPGIQRLYDSL